MSLAFAVQGLGFSVLVTHLPQFSDRYALGDGAVTAVVLMVTVLAGVGSVASEALAARASSRVALQVSLLLVGVSLALLTLNAGFGVAAVGFAFYGLAVGGVDATSNMQGVAVQARYGRSLIASFHASWSAAAIAGALYVALGEQVDLDLSASLAPVAVVALLAGWRLGPRLVPPGEGHVVTPEEPVDDDRSAPEVAAPAAGGMSAARPVLLVGLALTAFWAVDSSVSNWSALYLEDLHAGTWTALGYAGYQVTALLSRLGGDRAANRFGAASTVRAAAAIGTLGALVVVLAPNAAVAVAGFTLIGVGLPVVAPLCFTAVAQLASAGDGRYDSVAVDTAIARLNVFNYAGSLIGAAAVGAVGALASLRVGLVVALLMALGVSALAPVFARAEHLASS
ncbi:MFS transporter [Spongisporangium articulatum]|uniref:MFS transporter n=1 Tax=Spongisporangium articulatum TaxID=3362603 RepID=A0ABW8ALE5_9ACTN